MKKELLMNRQFFRKFFCVGIISYLCSCQYAQKVRVHGYIVDATSGEPISYAYCLDTVAGTHAFSNESGYFNMTCAKGSLLKFSYLGYIPLYWNAASDSFVTISLQPRVMEEVRVYHRERLYLQTLQGKTTISVAKMKTMPTFAGQADIIKNLTYLPGVSMGKEGFSNLYVRGGERDQNLILIDGAPLFSYNHAGGLVTSLNTEGIQNIDFYKAGFPARFGNFSSSVIDIKMKDGDAYQRKYKVQIGTLVSGFSAEGPLIKEKTTFSVSARTTYYDLINLPNYIKYLDTMTYNMDLQSPTGISYVSYNAFDLHMKITHTLSERHKLWVSTFTAQDYYTNKSEKRYATSGYTTRNTFALKNYLVSIGSRSVLSEKIFLNNYLHFSRYSNDFENDDFELVSADSVSFYRNEYSSINYLAYQGITDFSLGSRQTIKSGISVSYYALKPHIVYQHTRERGIQYDTLIGNSHIHHAYQVAIFAEDEIKINDWSINAGVRLDEYLTSSKNYFSTQPRLSVKRMLNDRSSLKISYSLNQQFLFSVTRTFLDLQKEIWFTVDSQLSPLLTHHGSIGLFGVFNDFEYGLEAYAKKMFNMVEYRSYSIRTNAAIIDLGSYYRNGKGESYGLEAFVGKEVGDIVGTLSYTLSYTYRQFPELNNGRRYPYIYDRRHVITLTGKLPIDRLWSVSLNFVFMTGQPLSVAQSKFYGNQFFEGYNIYSSINNYRLPPYHRLDLLLMRAWKSKRNFDRNLKISIYNAYNRRNPAYASANDNGVTIYSLFGIIPTVSYEIYF